MPLYRLHPQPRQSVVVADAASSSASTTTTIRRCRRCRFIVYIHDYNNLLLPPMPLHHLHPRLRQSLLSFAARCYHRCPQALAAAQEPSLCLLNTDSSSVGGESPAIAFTAADFSVCRCYRSLPLLPSLLSFAAAAAAATAAAAAAATATATAADVTTTSSTTGRRRCHRRRRSQHNDLVINDQPPLLPLPLPPRPLPLPLLRGLLPQQPPPGAGHGSEAAVTAGRTAVTFHLGLDQSAFFSPPPPPPLFTPPSLFFTPFPSYLK